MEDIEHAFFDVQCDNPECGNFGWRIRVEADATGGVFYCGGVVIVNGEDTQCGATLEASVVPGGGLIPPVPPEG